MRESISLIMPRRGVSTTTYYVTLAIISALIITSLVVYLFQVESLTQKNFLSKEYSTKISELQEHNLSLEATKTNLVSFDEAEEKIKDSFFTNVSKISYIPISFDYLARNTGR